MKKNELYGSRTWESLRKFIMVMKLSVFIILFSVIQLFAITGKAQQQRLTLDFEKTKVVDVLSHIEKESDYAFLYNVDLVDVERLASIKLEDASIREVLRRLFDDTSVSYRIMDNQVIILSSSDDRQQQQPKNVSGKVSDIRGVPLPGVSIVIKGTTVGTVTDFDGNFNLSSVSGDATLVFSFIGMKTMEIEVAGQTVFNITLEEDAIGIEEVVAIGYGYMKKSDLTGSVTRANIENFENQPNTSILQSLQGTVAGLNIGTVRGAGGNPSISIRGRNTFARDDDGNLIGNDPLIVLDGVIYRGSIIDINSADILSVDVLKDASSKAIYGSQAANGVVIITTKTGSKERKPKFTFSTYYASSEPTNRLHPLDREGYIQKASNMYWEEAFNVPDYTTPNPSFDPTTTWSSFDQIVDGYNDGTDTDWMDLVTQNAFIYNANANMSGSTDKTSYFLSAGYTDENGWAKNDTYDKINVRANFDTEIADWLTIGMQTFVSSGDYSGKGAEIRNAMIFSPLVKPYNEDGSINLFPQGNDRNPLAVLDIDNMDKRLNLFGNFYASVAIPHVKGLTYKINYSTNYRTRREFEFDPNGLNFTGKAFKNNSMSQDQTLDNTVTYIRSFSDKHNVSATLVYGYEEREGEKTEAISGTFNNFALGYNSLEDGEKEQQEVKSEAWDERSHYFMGRLNYKYNDKYIATFTIRRDGFSGFGSDKKFGTFPSAAFAWIASNENFVADALPWANHLKVRGSYGKSGNRTVGRYGTLARVNGGFEYVFGDGSSPSYGQYISSLANNGLGWETTTGINIGLDFGVSRIDS